MKVSGSSVLHAGPEKVWAAITDPAVLAGVIPGCDVLTPIETNRFALTVTLGVASIKGAYTGEVSFVDLREPVSLTMRANGSGGPGTIDTTVAVVLTALDDGTTRVDYDADAMVGGMVGGVGQRVLAGVAKRTAGLFFAAIDDVLTGACPLSTGPLSTGLQSMGPLSTGATSPSMAGTAAGSTVLVTTPQSRQQARPGPVSLVGAAAFGALSMLVGVLVGARIARRQG